MSVLVGFIIWLASVVSAIKHAAGYKVKDMKEGDVITVTEPDGTRIMIKKRNYRDIVSEEEEEAIYDALRRAGEDI